MSCGHEIRLDEMSDQGLYELALLMECVFLIGMADGLLSMGEPEPMDAITLAVKQRCPAFGAFIRAKVVELVGDVSEGDYLLSFNGCRLTDRLAPILPDPIVFSSE